MLNVSVLRLVCHTKSISIIRSFSPYLAVLLFMVAMKLAKFWRELACIHYGPANIRSRHHSDHPIKMVTEKKRRCLLNVFLTWSWTLNVCTLKQRDLSNAVDHTRCHRHRQQRRSVFQMICYMMWSLRWWRRLLPLCNMLARLLSSHHLKAEFRKKRFLFVCSWALSLHSCQKAINVKSNTTTIHFFDSTPHL